MYQCFAFCFFQIVFSDVAPRDEHLRRGALADLFLDTGAQNSHTTACDILLDQNSITSPAYLPTYYHPTPPYSDEPTQLPLLSITHANLLCLSIVKMLSADESDLVLVEIAITTAIILILILIITKMNPLN